MPKVYSIQPEPSKENIDWTENYGVYGYGPVTMGLKAWTYDPAAGTTSRTPAAASINLQRIAVVKPITVTNLCCIIGTAGTAYTNTQMGLYLPNGTFLGATAVLAAAGTNTFGTTGFKEVALTTPVGIDPGYYYVALHAGSNPATAFACRGYDTIGINGNVATTSGAARIVRATGHATNDLATIGNIDPNTYVATSLVAPWMGIS